MVWLYLNRGRKHRDIKEIKEIWQQFRSAKIGTQIAAILRGIWLERNNYIFNKKILTHVFISHHIINNAAL